MSEFLKNFTPERDKDIADAASEYDIPFDVLKAAIVSESLGNWNRDGERLCDLPFHKTRILPYVGLMEHDHPDYDFPALVGDHRGQVFLLARTLSDIRGRIDLWAHVMYKRYAGIDPVSPSEVFKAARATIREHQPVGY